MKTLAVVSALVAIAIAAPTYEEYTDSVRLPPRHFSIAKQREKKSTPVETQTVSDHLEEHTSEHHLNPVGPSNPRTFTGFKKPIIVKKKIGYYGYRDSEEEQSQTDSQENCKKQMMNKAKTASADHSHKIISETEMEHNINVAREAVQTFERDLQKMEHDCAENNKNRHTTLGSDAELHQDIEKARLALEHIQKKFKNLDSTTNIVDENNSKVSLRKMKSDEERMIQWKNSGNLHKNVEIARNLEDNYKSTSDTEELKHTKNNNFNNLNNANKDFKTTIEDIDASSRTSHLEDGMTSIVENKDRKMEIQSDSLIKGNMANDGSHQKEEELSRMEHHVIEQNEDSSNHEVRNHNQGVQEIKERAIKDKNNEFKVEQLKENDLHLTEKHIRTHVDNSEKLKSSDVEKESQNEHSHVSTFSGTNGKNTRSDEAEMIHEQVTTKTDKNKVQSENNNFEHRNSLAKDAGSIHSNIEHGHHDDNKQETHHTDLERSTQVQHMQKSETHDLKNEDGIDMDSVRSSSTMTISKLDNEKDTEKTHFNNNIDNHAIEPSHLRATSDFNKDLLNHMDFTEDSHHMALHQPSLTDESHMMKNDKSELHERLNVPRVHPNPEHLKTIMQFSDSSPHLKMASMFDNVEPNFNVQFNSPQDFAEQTNVQEVMPFRTTSVLHDSALDHRFKSMHDNSEIPTELHDPLRVHWANSENMRMDGSSQHFNIEKLSPLRSNLMNDQHLILNEQMRAQQRWPQAKSMNGNHAHVHTNFEHLHAQDASVLRNNGHNMFMHEKSNLDGTNNQQSSFSQIRGAPKMALEHANPNQWTHNHGAFRSSYGPSLPASYGSGGSSGSAVGVFPNANVGNCAVPILLSCSPSVVSGSLAKTQNAYSAPAYRSEDVNFHKKRGVDIVEATAEENVRNSQLGHRPNTILEKDNNTV